MYICYYSNNSFLNPHLPPHPLFHFSAFLYNKTLPDRCLCLPSLHLFFFFSTTPIENLSWQDHQRPPHFQIPEPIFSSPLTQEVSHSSFWKHCLHSASSTPLPLGSLISLHFPLLVSFHPSDFCIPECPRA